MPVLSADRLRSIVAVLYPGEIEWRREQERLKSGIEVEDKTWKEMLSLAAKFGVSKEIGA